MLKGRAVHILYQHQKRGRSMAVWRHNIPLFWLNVDTSPGDFCLPPVDYITFCALSWALGLGLNSKRISCVLNVISHLFSLSALTLSPPPPPSTLSLPSSLPTPHSISRHRKKGLLYIIILDSLLQSFSLPARYKSSIERIEAVCIPGNFSWPDFLFALQYLLGCF